MKLVALAAAALLSSDAAPPAIRLHLGCLDGLPAVLVIEATGPGTRTVRLIDLIERCEAAQRQDAPQPAPQRPAVQT